jgi:hypothetical protein
MQQGFWAKFSAWIWRVWRDGVRRAVLVTAVLTMMMLALLAGPPYFSTASQPQTFSDPVLALELVRDLEEVRLILSDAPSQDRETMRIKTYIDYGFIASYSGLSVSLALLAARRRGWRMAAAIVGGICGVFTGVFDVLENRAILTILDVSLRDTTENMLNGIRGASLAKWMLAGVALAAFAVSFFRVKKT